MKMSTTEDEEDGIVTEEDFAEFHAVSRTRFSELALTDYEDRTSNQQRLAKFYHYNFDNGGALNSIQEVKNYLAGADRNRAGIFALNHAQQHQEVRPSTTQMAGGQLSQE